jgi:hypothetical protein
MNNVQEDPVLVTGASSTEGGTLRKCGAVAFGHAQNVTVKPAACRDYLLVDLNTEDYRDYSQYELEGNHMRTNEYESYI